MLYFLNKKDKVVAKEVLIEPKEETVIKTVTVEIKGAIITPGVYTLNEGSRVVDLITAAGGLNEDANIDYINQSKILEDQNVIKIYTNKEIEESNRVEVVTKYIEKECNCPKILNDACINTKQETNEITKEVNTSNSNTGLVNINNCTLDQLLTLPGIGESKAKAILEYRQSNKFEKIEDVKNVTGIGASLYEKIKDYIEV